MRKIRHFSVSLIAVITLLVGLGAQQVWAEEYIKFGKTSVDVSKTGYINGPEISPANSVHYNHETKTLTLNDATVDAPIAAGEAIFVSMDDLTIILNGNNTAKSADTNYPAIWIQTTTTVTIKGHENGTGTLKTSGTGSAGIEFVHLSGSKATLHIVDVKKLNLVGSEYGIWRFTPTLESFLVIENSKIIANGPKGSIVGFDDLQFKNAKIKIPDGATYDKTKSPRGVYQGANLVKTEVTIIPAYELYLKGTQVTGLNTHNILGDGRCFYQHDSKTLYLNNANIEHNGYAIRSDIDGLTIELDGDNTAINTKTNDESGISLSKNTTRHIPPSSATSFLF